MNGNNMDTKKIQDFNRGNHLDEGSILYPKNEFIIKIISEI